MKTGFTLIELLVVVLIIGILSAVALPQYQKAVDKTRFSSVLAVLKNVKNAQEVFYLANGYYSNNFSNLDIDLPPGGTGMESSKVDYPNGMSFHFQVLGDGTAASVYGYGAGMRAVGGIEVYFDHHTDLTEMSGLISCAAATPRARDVCRSMGGVLRIDYGDGLGHYTLPW